MQVTTLNPRNCDLYHSFQTSIGKRSPLTTASREICVSTGRRGLAEYTERVIAHASTELGLTINPPMDRAVREAMKRYAARGQKVNAETGEIEQVPA